MATRLGGWRHPIPWLAPALPRSANQRERQSRGCRPMPAVRSSNHLAVSTEVTLLRFEFLLADFSPRVPLAKDVEGCIRPRALALSHEPPNAEHDSYNDKSPEHQHPEHH